jgi:hypothetical protein
MTEIAIISLAFGITLGYLIGIIKAIAWADENPIIPRD